MVKIPIKEIPTHSGAHCDEKLAVWLLRNFGEFLFPGISTAMIMFWSQNQIEKSAEEYEREGKLLVGIGGGRFDEHSGVDGKRKANMSAALLVAEELGLADDEMLKPLLKFVTQRDLKAAGSDGAAFEIPELIKKMYRTMSSTGMTVEEIWQWAFKAFDAIYADAKLFFEQASGDFDRARHYSIRNSRGSVELAVGTSASEKFAQYARSPHGCRAAIVIQKNPTKGNVQIQTAKRARLDISDVVRAVRVEELKLNKCEPPTDWPAFWETLAGENPLPKCPWYYHHEGQMLLNGSVNIDMPATKIPLPQIEHLVQIGVNHRAFPPTRAKDCSKGKCTSTDDDRCPWFAYGLPRCREIRGELAEITSAGVAPASDSKAVGQ